MKMMVTDLITKVTLLTQNIDLINQNSDTLVLLLTQKALLTLSYLGITLLNKTYTPAIITVCEEIIMISETVAYHLLIKVSNWLPLPSS